MHYPAHAPRQSDPHYVDFEAYRREHIATAKCAFGESINNFSECHGDLELHHSHVEFSLQNGVDLSALEAAGYTGISDPTRIGAWVESGANLLFLCEFHHRGHGGIHVASSSDYEAERFVRGLIT